LNIYSTAEYVSHIKKEAYVDANEVLALEAVQAKAALAVDSIYSSLKLR